MAEPEKKDTKEPETYHNILAQIASSLFGNSQTKPKLQSYEDYAKQFGPKEPQLNDYLEAEQKAANKRAEDLGYGRKGTDNLLRDAAGRAQKAYAAQMEIYTERREKLPEEYKAYVAEFNQQREDEKKTEAAKSTYEQYPVAVKLGSAVAIVAVGVAGNRIGARNTSLYNQELQNLSGRAEAASEGVVSSLKSANKSADEMLATASNARILQELSDQQAKLVARGVGGGYTTPMIGCAAGDMVFLSPLALDYVSSVPGSELRKKTLQSLKVTEVEFWSRLSMGCALGGSASKIGDAVAKTGKEFKPAYTAEAAAIKDAVEGNVGVIENLRKYRQGANPTAAETVAAPSSVPNALTEAAPAIVP